MPRTSERGGPQTRARISEAAARLFLERGFEAVTVAEIAREAGVSSVTVFNHFPRKEDLFLDRSIDADQLLRAAVTARENGDDILDSLRRATLRLVDERHPLTGTDARSVPFFRTVADSPALVARARELAGELQATLADALADDPGFDGDAGLVAALFIAGYGAVLVDTARRQIAGDPEDAVLADNRARFERLFAMLRDGISG